MRGMLKAGAAVPEEVWVYDHHHENVQALQEEYPGVHEAASEADAADAVEVLILAVKPHGVLPLISSLSERGAELPLLISIAAAVSLDDMEACASDGTRIIRAMPNTPCMVLAGVIAYSTGNGVKDEDEEAARMLLSGCGSVYKVAESGMNAVSAISGCGPAYMFTALDALADAGVAMGLSRKTALGLAAETMRGASLMLERTGKHPMALRDEVTSPGGTTIAALNALDEGGEKRRTARGGNGGAVTDASSGFPGSRLSPERTAWRRSLYLHRNGVSLCFLSSGFCRLNWTFLTDWSGILTLPTADERPSMTPFRIVSRARERTLWSVRKTRVSELSSGRSFSSWPFWSSARTLAVGTVTS